MGVYNASYHRLQLIASDRTAIKLDYGRHLRAHTSVRTPRSGTAHRRVYRHRSRRSLRCGDHGRADAGERRQVAVAGGLRNEPIAVTHALTQDLIYPAETEIVLEGLVSPVDTVREGPFGEFVGYLSPRETRGSFRSLHLRIAPLLFITRLTASGLETVMLRKYVMEASLSRRCKRRRRWWPTSK